MKKYDVVVKTGSYKKNGETKNRYENIGAIMQSDNGPFLLLKRTFNPAGINSEGDQILCSLFDVNRDKQAQSAPQQAPANDFNDDIPF